MNRALRLAACGIAGVVMQMAFVTGASAEYMGYGNGDPGNWDFNTEQQGGPCGTGVSHAIDATTGQPACCAQYNPMSACPLYRASVDTGHIRHYRKPATKQ